MHSTTVQGKTAFAVDSRVQDFFQLLKPRVMSLVVFTGLVGLLLAPGSLHPVLAGVALLCIAVGAGAAGAINMWYDRDIDAKMQRTQLKRAGGKTEAAQHTFGHRERHANGNKSGDRHFCARNRRALAPCCE